MTTPCPPEHVLAAHADGELPLAEARALDAHLEVCPSCRSLLEALRVESRLLSRVLGETAPAPAPRRTSIADLATVGLCLLGAAAGLEYLLGFVGEVGQQSPVDLDTRSFVVSVVFDTGFYLLREGASMLTPLVTAVAVVALSVLAALYVRSTRRRSAASALLLIALVAGLARPASALERRIAKSSHEDITVPAGETVDDTLLATGDTVAIDGIVTGNLIACAQRVIIRGTVKGDLVTAGQRVEISGSVEGNVIGASQTLVVRGPIARSLHAFTEHLALDREGRVEGDVMGFAGILDLEGRVGRDLVSVGGVTNFKGEVGRNASTWTERVRVDRAAIIGGDLTTHTHAKEKVVLDPAATVRGKTDTRVETKQRRNRFLDPKFYVWRLVWLAAAFLTGMVVRMLVPGLFAARLGPELPVGRALNLGFVGVVAVPVAIVIVALTVVGLPLALLTLALWTAGVYLSWVLAGSLVGQAVLSRGETEKVSFPLALLLGLAILTTVAYLPFVGWLIKAFVTLFGFGVGLIQARRLWRAAPVAA